MRGIARSDEIFEGRAEDKEQHSHDHTKYVPTYLTEFGSGFQILLEAAEGRIVVVEVCTRGPAAAAPQIGGHGMRNVVVVVGHHAWLACVIAGTQAAGKDARLGDEVRRFDRIAGWMAG